MSLPTVHWSRVAGDLNPGQQVAVAHGLKTWQCPNGVTPDAVLMAFRPGLSAEMINHNIHMLGPIGADATFVYLSNWSPTDGEGYCFIARKYHSIDGKNL